MKYRDTHLFVLFCLSIVLLWVFTIMARGGTPQPMVTTAQWRDRGQVAHSFDVSDIAGGQGRPRVRLRACFGVRIVKRFKGVTGTRVVSDLADGKEFRMDAKWRVRYRSVQQYSLPTGKIVRPEFGILRTLIVLDEKPSVNIWDIVLDVPEGTGLYEQPPLTQAEIDEGCVRPIHIQYSVAVYFNGLKLGHIYRPVAWERDNPSNWTWGQLQVIDGGVRKIIPQPWLNNATYPVITDDTFGYDTAGSSSTSYADDLASTGPWSPDFNGSATAVWAYYGAANGDQATLGFYADSTGQPGALAADGDGIPDPGTNNPAWREDVLDAPEAVLAANSYHPAYVSDNSTSLYWDNAAIDGDIDADIGYVHGTLPDPYPNPSARTRQHSVYVVYTPDVGAGILPLANHHYRQQGN